MIGEVNAVPMPEQFMMGMYQVGSFTEMGISYEFLLDAAQMVPVIYRRDKNVFWHITWSEMLNLARAAGIDGSNLH